MIRLLARLGVFAAGALAMYYLDPQMGRQRRGLLGDLVRGGLQQTRESQRVMQGRLGRRAYHRLAYADPHSDAQLRDRIRDRLGRMVSHPRAIDVRVENGVVRLSGDVLLKERDGLLQQVRDMAGVQKLVNAMTAHESPNGIASLETREAEAESTSAVA
jgi:osmotically-inducible protein OsmY